MDGITESGRSTESVRGGPPQRQIVWRVLEGSRQRIVVCSMQSRTTGVEVRIVRCGTSNLRSRQISPEPIRGT